MDGGGGSAGAGSHPALERERTQVLRVGSGGFFANVRASAYPLLAVPFLDQWQGGTISRDTQKSAESAGVKQPGGSARGHRGVFKFSNHDRNQEGFGKGVPADVYFGRWEEILKQRMEQKRHPVLSVPVQSGQVVNPLWGEWGGTAGSPKTRKVSEVLNTHS